MVFEYLVVSSGTGQMLTQNQLNTLGASNWELVQVVTPANSLVLTYIFKK